MVWEDRLSVNEVIEEKKKTPKFPSRERNFAIKRRGTRQVALVNEIISNNSLISAYHFPHQRTQDNSFNVKNIHSCCSHNIRFIE